MCDLTNSGSLVNMFVKSDPMTLLKTELKEKRKEEKKKRKGKRKKERKIIMFFEKHNRTIHGKKTVESKKEKNVYCCVS